MHFHEITFDIHVNFSMSKYYFIKMAIFIFFDELRSVISSKVLHFNLTKLVIFAFLFN